MKSKVKIQYQQCSSILAGIIFSPSFSNLFCKKLKENTEKLPPQLHTTKHMREHSVQTTEEWRLWRAKGMMLYDTLCIHNTYENVCTVDQQSLISEVKHM